MITNKELWEQHNRLLQEVIDDSEEDLEWIGENGVALIEEMLLYRHVLKVLSAKALSDGSELAKNTLQLVEQGSALEYLKMLGWKEPE